MADKKITALTELSATAKAGEDFLHIIDYGGGSSPVNKRISLTNLFSKINLDTHIYGTSKTFEIGSTDSASSAFKVTTTDTTTLTTAKQNEVVVNDDRKIRGLRFCKQCFLQLPNGVETFKISIGSSILRAF